MNTELPLKVEVNNNIHYIREKCDYRVILDVIEIMNDNDLDNLTKVKLALYSFYESYYNKANSSEDVDGAISDIILDDEAMKLFEEIQRIINLGSIENGDSPNRPKLIDWGKDFKHIAPPVSRVLGYSVRSQDNYTHWYDFIGAFHEIGECYFSNILSIREKQRKGKKLEKYEREFLNNNYQDIMLPIEINSEAQAWLDDVDDDKWEAY